MLSDIQSTSHYDCAYFDFSEDMLHDVIDLENDTIQFFQHYFAECSKHRRTQGYQKVVRVGSDEAGSSR